jgi:hypothetical protein
MSTNRSSIRRVVRIVLAAALSLTAMAAAKAFEVTAEQRAACTPDAFRLCSSAIPDANKVMACMKANEASLSAPCRSVFQTAARELGAHKNYQTASRQLAAHRNYTAYANNRDESAGARHTRLAYQALPSHGHRMHRMASNYAGYRETAAAGAGWIHSRDEREALIIGRKVMIGYAMACQNHSIPDDLCNLSGRPLAIPEMSRDSSKEGSYQGESQSAQSSPAPEANTQSESQPIKIPELGNWFGSLIQ